MDPRALVLTLGATLCWGSAQVIGKLVLRNISTLLFNGIRFSVAALVVVSGIALTGGFGNLGGNWPVAIAFLSGVVGWFIAAQLFFYSLKREAAHRIIPTGNSYPFWAIALAPLFLGEELRLVLPLSAVLIFVGSVLLVARRRKTSYWRMGVPAACFAAFLWGLNAVLNKHCLNSGMTISALLSIRLLTAAVLFNMVVGISRRGKTPGIDRGSTGLSALSGIISFPVGSLMYLTALNMEQASTLAPVTGMTIFFGFLLSILLVGERPTKRSVLGTIFILAGVLSITA
jgi:DME family drug/metabolite transporter